jgi:hypothetical protein
MNDAMANVFLVNVNVDVSQFCSSFAVMFVSVCLGLLSRLAHDHVLAYVAADMSALDHAWPMKQIYSPSAYTGAKTELCVTQENGDCSCSHFSSRHHLV